MLQGDCETPAALSPEAAAELETLAGQVRGWDAKIRHTSDTLRTQRQFREQARHRLALACRRHGLEDYPAAPDLFTEDNANG